MQISLWVPYDERRLRRTITFLARSQLRAVRIIGAVPVPLGVLLIVLDPTLPLAYVSVIIGLFLLFAAGPITVARSVRAQSRTIRDGQQLTLDDEWVTVTYPLAESRFRWAGLDTVIETPEVWYAMFGRFQAIAIPKAEMTDGQRAEFAAFVARLWAAPPVPAA
ncbi:MULTISPECIES: YcxB family protein [Catenuloplanes]|uniref:YcxB-like C-terminal domain-containing protein n=1 Tax=Catenuloplanes niger TaxID=587534 RepID=A0AAE3ZXZ5_9ACTN|nr:YcxB family protein [Catenuloplanes niger]MDR7327946.1 hypothetical protein [Catenuloplanes niger]